MTVAIVAEDTPEPVNFLLNDAVCSTSGCFNATYLGMFWIALAAQISMPLPIGLRVPDVRAIFSYQDYPADLLAAGISGTVFARITVRPDGVVQDCVAEATSGNRELDTYTCRLIVKRARFAPAKWTDGSPAYGVVAVPVTWSIGMPRSEEQGADLELSVNQLPEDARSVVGLALEIAVDETGNIVTCVEYPSVASRPRYFPELVRLACQQATTGLTVTPAVDASGRPVRSVQALSVRFKKDRQTK
jgi:TonB family protein